MFSLFVSHQIFLCIRPSDRKKKGERSPLFRPHSTSATTFARGLLEKKEERTGETDPRLEHYREMMEEQRQEIERQYRCVQIAAPMVVRTLDYYNSNQHRGNAFTALREEEVITLVRNADQTEILKATPKGDSWEVLPTPGHLSAMDLELLEKTQQRLRLLEVEERKKRNKAKDSIDLER
jgi:hypothetical protein